MTRRGALRRAALLPFAAIGQPAHAQARWPDRAVTLVVPFAPGGSNDISARLLAPRLQSLLGQSFIVENRSGGGGSIGTQQVARAPADGYTALVSAASNHVIYPHVARMQGATPPETLQGVSALIEVPLVLAVPTRLGIGNLGQLLALLRREPGKHSFASSGVGSTHHLAGEVFAQRAGVDITHVPYRGGGPALAALLAGEITMAFLNLPTILPQAQAGTLRILGLTEARRSALQPDLPTLEEAGLPGVLVPSWAAVFVPRGTPAPVVARFNAAIREALADEALQARFLALGVDPRASTPEELDAVVARDFAFWGPVVRTANITP
ncbi:tripartite tricarboxylate transporter substrate binding protein [Sediminicoccus sp. KRV36]|uniref:Bug family tripartite tricarboxylate transporter substrate binding protein n=1 Tax=Sediminicoccus sp. KRV36 TaxID=3133721 RepID=UPI00200E6EA6|nr:tripartite tricarboxylate transporter substrate binding protein [Sediminicoccus rosea]UPY38876.1 tripartite tricarboxylate transporter substrate binding protein [Sediminicoccus rosea]